MSLSLPPITPEMRAAFLASGGAPIQVHDPQTQQVYVMEPVVEITLDEQYIREKIDEAIADVEAGRVAPWDVEAFLAEAHRRFAEQNR